MHIGSLARRAKPFLTMAAVGGVAVTLAACGGNGSGSNPGGQKYADGKTFTMLMPADPGNLDPHFTSLASALAADRFLYDSLLNTDPGRRVVRVADEVDVRGDHAGGERAAVGTRDSLAQHVLRGRRRALPPLREAGDHLAARVDVEQRVVEESIGRQRARERREMGVEIAGVGGHEHGERLAVGVLLATGV